MKIPNTWTNDCQQVKIRSQQQEQSPKNTDTDSVDTRTVRFAADVTVHSVISVEDYSEAELEACFYNKTDYKNFKRSSLITLKLNREGELDATKHCMRGLECRTREGAAAKKAAKNAAMAAAFQELLRQASEDVQDADILAQTLRQVTVSQQHQASIRGMCDELEVREYQHLALALTVSRKQLTMARPAVGPLKLSAILDHPEITTVAGPAA